MHGQSPEAERGRAGYATFIVLIFLVNLINYLDRQLPYILIEQIKADLSLSDAEIGLVGGMTFTLVYSITTVPIAALADRWSSKWVLTSAIALWCSLTMLCGQAVNLLQFGATRIGVAVGEAGCVPASHSLISNLVPQSRRAFAIAIFSLGIPFGGMLGLWLGGWIGDAYGWRNAMLFVGAPGVLLALAVALLIPDRRAPAAAVKPRLDLQRLRGLFATATMVHIVIGISVQGIAQYAIYSFSAAFLIRSHGLSMGDVGFGLGLANGISGALGLLVGGWVASVSNRNALRLAGTAFIASAPLVLAALNADHWWAALVLLGIFNFCAVFYMPSVFSTVQQLAPADGRALASSMMVLGVGLVGGSIGPTLVGVLSDALAPGFGADALRAALMFTVVPLVWSGCHLLVASRRVDHDLRSGRACH